jgi:hypothetical protein
VGRVKTELNVRLQHIKAGLPQGAVLSPILFIIYTADIQKIPHIQLALFADDTALYTQSWRIDTITRRLTDAVTRFHSYFPRWRLKVNPSKTDAIIFTKRRPHPNKHIVMEKVEVPWSQKVKYLGLHMTSTLNYLSHIQQVTQKAIGILVQLFPLLAKESTLSVGTKLQIYKAVIRSTLTYAAPTWCSISNSTYRNLEVVQNKCIRDIANAPRGAPISHLLATLGVETIQTYVRRIAESFYAKCYLHPNPMVGAIGQYTLNDLKRWNKRYKHKRPKHCML